MEHKNIFAAGFVLILIVAGMFIFAYIKKTEINEQALPAPVTEREEETPYDNITRIDAKHFYIDGTHTLVGEIQMPTPCDLLNWDAQVAESMPEQVTIAFGIVNTTETCPQTITAQRFKVSFKASIDAVMRATLQGRAVELNLIPAGEGETPDDFELFIKG